MPLHFAHSCPDPVLASHLSRIEVLMFRLGNADTRAANEAAKNLMHRQPAFWCASNHNRAQILVSYANTFHGIGEAWDALAKDFPPTHDLHDGAQDEALLDLVLPLNREGVDSLSNAYTLVSTFRTRRELIARTERVEGGAMPASEAA